MKILYGVNGEGMGHATRSEVVIGSLLAGGHDVRVMASGAAFRYLEERLGDVNRIFGPSLAMEQGEIRRWASVTRTMEALAHELPGSVRTWMRAVEAWRPDVVVTDFEPLSASYARTTHTPLVCVDNIHMIDRCLHDEEILAGARGDFQVARTVTRAMSRVAGDYVVLTFFHPPLRYGRTDLVPPIVRPAVIAAEPARGEHLVVYSSGSEALDEALRACGAPCRVYGMREDARAGTSDGPIDYRPRSVDGFLEDLASCRGVVTGGGFSLLSEAVYLGKPTLSVPLGGQFEQIMNARYLEREGYGLCAPEIDAGVLGRFLARLDDFQERLDAYEQNGNEEALDVITRRVTAAAGDDARARRRARREARARPR
jgi:uncharacterized protein (TIGR00661 family)